MSIHFIPGDNKKISICKEDAEHHAKFFATGSFGGGRKTPTPVEVFTFTAGFAVVPSDYLDKFTPESIYYDEIQKYKAENASVS